jgi:hypothetical protein
MTEGSGAAWRGDPYRRHELRYWDGQVWTAHVSDMGVGDLDPVFPVPDGSGRNYLAIGRARRSGPTRNSAAAWAIGGFMAVVALAVASTALGAGDTSPGPAVSSVQPAVAVVDQPGSSPRHTLSPRP